MFGGVRIHVNGPPHKYVGIEMLIDDAKRRVSEIFSKFVSEGLRTASVGLASSTTSYPRVE